MNPEQALVEFRRYLKLRQLSPRTVAGYTEDLSLFFRFLEERAHDNILTVDTLLADDFRGWISARTFRDKGLAPSTQAQRIRVAWLLFHALVQWGRLQRNPITRMRVSACRRVAALVVPSEAETERMLETADTTSPVGVRDRSIMELLYGSALRNTELAELKVHDIDADNAMVTVRHAKGRKSRVTPVTGRALEWLTRYRQSARQQLLQNPGESRLFVTDEGRPLTRQAILALVGRAARRAHLQTRVWPHLLRHAAATHMFERGASLEYIREMLGHDVLVSSQRYIHLSLEHFRIPVNCLPAAAGFGTTVAELVTEYAKSLVNSGQALATLEANDRCLGVFANHCADRGIRSLRRFDKRDLAIYVEWLETKPFTEHTRYLYLRLTRAFLRWSHARGDMHADPTPELLLPRPTQVIRKYLSTEQIESILLVPDSTPGGLRDSALLETLYFAALEREECEALDVHDVDLHDACIRVRHPRQGTQPLGDRRVLPLPLRLVDSLSRYLHRSRPQLVNATSGSALFVGRGGRRLSRQGILVAVKNCGRRAGLPLTVSPRVLRHSAAVHLLDQGMTDVALAKFLGQELTSALIFRRQHPIALQREHSRTHPRA